MSKLTDTLRTVRVFNPHGFYREGHVYIAYHANQRMHPSHWSVYGVGFDTNPGGPWYTYGRKEFGLFGHNGSNAERKAVALAEAQAWASEHYGIREWARDPFGSYGDAEFVKARVAELKSLAAEAVKS